MARQASTLLREKQIIELLRENPSSIRGLADQTGWNYYTIRNIIANLAERGIIKLYDTVERERIYTYNTDSKDQHDHIPRLVSLVNKQTQKAIFLLELTGRESKTAGAFGVRNLPRHMAHLMHLANQARLGADIAITLNNLREEMQRDLIRVQGTVSLYEQILKDPRFWNVKFLQEMTQDTDYNYQAVENAKDYFDNLEEKEGL